ncbi:MAG TPA: hypothetical protein VKK61_04360 [Tepidisphaeraceae bacterium]|nr:hypothetical protein [Tepidisphaeraceae bacterium]
MADELDIAMERPQKNLARIVLVWFVFIFIAARMLVLLIMLRKVPDLYMHMGQTHVHHLNYGIFLLVSVGAFLLFVRPTGQQLSWAAAIYGIGLALTFDEFGMWLHLGGSYWQRGSFDAVVVVAAILSLIAIAPEWNKLRSQHWIIAIAMVIVVSIFGVMLWRSMQRFGNRVGPRLIEIEQSGPAE